MHALVDYDPEVFNIVETDIAKYLRRETGRPELVTYQSRWNGSWVAALYDGSKVLDVGYLGDGSGEPCERPWLSREQGLYLVQRLNDLITLAEGRRRLRSCIKRHWRGIDALDAQLKRSVERTVRAVKRRRGAHAAEKVLQIAKRDKITGPVTQDVKV